MSGKVIADFDILADLIPQTMFQQRSASYWNSGSLFNFGAARQVLYISHFCAVKVQSKTMCMF